MAIYRETIIKQAQKWIGKKESDNSHREIIDVYNSHLPRARGYKVKYTDAWCATFVSAVSIACGATDIIPTECGCERMITLFKNIGCWEEADSYKPSAGDIIFYDWDDNGIGDNKGYSDHVGIVEAVSGSTITVIEGNYSDSVKRRKINVDSRYIRGFGKPKYDDKLESASSDSLAIGDKVTLAAGATYYDGKKIPAWVFKSTLYVRSLKGDRIVVSTLKVGAITGAVNIKYLKKQS